MLALAASPWRQHHVEWPRWRGPWGRGRDWEGGSGLILSGSAEQHIGGDHGERRGGEGRGGAPQLRGQLD